MKNSCLICANRMVLFVVAGSACMASALVTIQNKTGDRNSFTRFGFGVPNQYAMARLNLRLRERNTQRTRECFY